MEDGGPGQGILIMNRMNIELSRFPLFPTPTNLIYNLWVGEMKLVLAAGAARQDSGTGFELRALDFE